MKIKIISWNCNMAFRKKYDKVIELNPDLLVIQECENDSKLKGHLESMNYNQLVWYGDNPHKGIAIISFNNLEIELSKNNNPEFRYVVPIKLQAGKRTINLFCIWAMPHKSETSKHYIGQIWGAINFYSNDLNEESILIGDFNSNAIWDKKKRVGNHTDVVDFLGKKNIQSIYHQKNGVKHGKEKHPTLFLLKKLERPYHIDYCFVSKSLFSRETTIEIGKYEEWIKLSDHMPVIINNLTPSQA
jgi:exonuclease III